MPANPGFNSNWTAIAAGFNHLLALQADGKIILGATGNPLPGLLGSGLGRLNPDGTVDPTFDPGVYGSIMAISIQVDGRILLGGLFTELAGQARSNLGRLDNTDPATSDLFRDGSQVVWLRGGASPEIWRATFEYSTNLANWVSLGAGARITGGWRVAAGSLPTNCTVRARGFIANATASWFVESRLALTDMPPTILTQNASIEISPVARKIAEEHGEPIRREHAEGRADDDQHRRRVMRGHRDGRKLRLVAHFGQEERDGGRAEINGDGVGCAVMKSGANTFSAGHNDPGWRSMCRYLERYCRRMPSAIDIR